jgi:hypothetical protein
MSDGMIYDRSPVPASKPGGPATDRNADRAIRTDEHGKLNYDSAAAEGRVEIELPALPNSPTTTETLHAVNFGPHVASRIEASMERNPYLKSGPQQSPPQTFAHYVAVAKGAGLLDAGALKRAETLSKEFAGEADQKEYYEMVVRPWLHGLTPKRRQS